MDWGDMIEVQPRIKPHFALISGILAVSTGAIFAKLADAPAIVIAAYRVGLATLVLAPIAFWKAREELSALSYADLMRAMIAGGFLALHFGTWISSLNYTSVANSVVLVNTNPLWVGLLSPFVTGERVKPVVYVGIIMSVIGATIIGIENAGTAGEGLIGDFLALLGGICASAYLLLGRNLRKRLSLISYVFVCYGSAAFILWIVVIVSGMAITGYGANTVFLFWAMALVPQLIGHTSYNWALKWFSTGVIAVSLLGEPIGSTIMAYFIFDEGLSVQKLIGAIIILSAICLAGSSEQSRTSGMK